MKTLPALAALGLLLIIAGPALSEDMNPGNMAIGMDFDLSAAVMDLRVNDVPVLDPENGLAAKGKVISQLLLNPAFHEGRNSVSVRLRLDSGAEGSPPAFKGDFGIWPVGDDPMPFDGRPMALHMTVVAGQNAGGTETAPILTSRIGSQPALTATAPLASDDAEASDGWHRYDFDLDVKLPLPPMAWTNGQPLTNDKATADAVTAQLETLHAAFAQGYDSAMARLKPFNSRQAAAIGTTPEEFSEASFRMLFDNTGYNLTPFDASKSELRLYGDGRLATMVPIPLAFDNDDTDEHATLYIYFWKDQNGNWQIIH